MSFSSEVKKELCRTESFDREVLRAELYGMLLFGKTFRDNQIVFTTESSHAARRITMLLENLFMPIIEKQTALRPKSDDAKLYRISLLDSGECRRVFESFGHVRGEVTLRVNRANVSSDEQAAATMMNKWFFMSILPVFGIPFFTSPDDPPTARRHAPASRSGSQAPDLCCHIRTRRF